MGRFTCVLIILYAPALRSRREVTGYSVCCHPACLMTLSLWEKIVNKYNLLVCLSTGDYFRLLICQIIFREYYPSESILGSSKTLRLIIILYTLSWGKDRNTTATAIHCGSSARSRKWSYSLACRCETAGMVINVTVGTYVHTGKYDIYEMYSGKSVSEGEQTTD